jgi:hypothetical protein
MFSKIPKIFKGLPVVYIDEKTIVPQARYPAFDSPNPWVKNLIALRDDIIKNGMLYPLELDDISRLVCRTGNQRLHILRYLGVKMVPVVIRGAGRLPNQTKPARHTSATPQFPKNACFLSGKERVKKNRKKKLKF